MPKRTSVDVFIIIIRCIHTTRRTVSQTFTSTHSVRSSEYRATNQITLTTQIDDANKSAGRTGACLPSELQHEEGYGKCFCSFLCNSSKLVFHEIACFVLLVFFRNLLFRCGIFLCSRINRFYYNFLSI